MTDLEMEHGDVTKEESRTKRRCGMDMDYVKSISGLVKGNQIGWSFIAFFISCFVGLHAIFIIFTIVLCIGTFVTLSIFLVFAFSCATKITRIDFYLVDFLMSILGTVAYFLVSLLSLTFSGVKVIMIIAAVIGFLAMLGFAVNIWFSFRQWWHNRRRTKENN